MLRDVFYEWTMAHVAASGLAQAVAAADPWGKNVFLEDFLLHARVIRDFFAPRGHTQDVLMRDFLPHPPRVSLPLLRSRAVRNRLNKRIAHLSFERPRFRTPWNVPRLMDEIDAAMEVFRDRLRHTRPELVRRLQPKPQR